jgi:hypothetical protein
MMRGVETLPVRYASSRYRVFRAASAVAVGLLFTVILTLTAPLTTMGLGILTATWTLVGWQAIRGARLCLEVRVDSVMVRNPLRTWHIHKAAIRAADGDGRAFVLPGMRGGPDLETGCISIQCSVPPYVIEAAGTAWLDPRLRGAALQRLQNIAKRNR